MRKLIVIVALLLSAIVSVRARDAHPQPIIAAVGNKLFTVSPEDGAAVLLAEPETTQQFVSPIDEANLSPNSHQFVYIMQGSMDTPDAEYISELRLVNLSDLSTVTINPAGGIFDVPAKAGHRFYLQSPAWSVDGTRVYYYRLDINLRDRSNYAGVQLAYYDTVTQQHELVARLDPTLRVEDLQTVAEGVVARMYETGFTGATVSTLFAPDNSIISEHKEAVLYLNAVDYQGRSYYARQDDFGSITALIALDGGDEPPIGVGYYPTAISQAVGEESLHVGYFFGSPSRYGVYGADPRDFVGEIEEMAGVSFGISPDGKAVAYVQYVDSVGNTPITIIEADGDTRELPFVASTVIWGALDYVPMGLPG